MASDPTAVTTLYGQIPLNSMTQVSDSYMAWYVERVTRSLDETLAAVNSELRENDAKEVSFRPSDNELGAIGRLQKSGVKGEDLLDRMVEQGEDWLMLTMRRLDHFERTGLAPKDYSTWCEHALSGAYDWIDHERLGGAGAPTGASAARASGAPQPSNVPEWLGNRGQQPDGPPTAPVPSVAPRWNDGNGYYGQGQGQAQGQQGAPAGAPQRPAAQQGPDDSDGKGRNIFRIFTN